MQWLYEARKKHGLIILDYMVTSNHIHLLVYDHGEQDVIPKSIQLLAGRVGQEYNVRKKRNGAFWQDRYHATAIETGEHLLRCIVYIDLNMVRTGVINHPSQWYWCGYNEIQNPRQKNILIDYEKLRELAGYDSFEIFQSAHRKWIDSSLATLENKHESHWTESVATGSDKFIKEILSELRSMVRGRKVVEAGQAFQIREEMKSYNALFDTKKCDIGPENLLYWNENPIESIYYRGATTVGCTVG
jgi:putative transposase